MLGLLWPGPTVESASDPVSIATKAAFVSGQHFSFKDERPGVFKLQAFDEHGATFVEHVVGPNFPASHHTKFDDLKETWRKYKRKLQASIDCAATDPHTVTGHELLAKEAIKATVFTELMDLGKQYADCGQPNVQFYLHPSEVRAKTAAKKDEIKLAPTTSFGRIMTRKSPGSSEVITEDGPLYLEAPTKPISDDSKEWKKYCVFAAYWWVSTSDEQSDCNMKYTKVNVDSCTFCVLENSESVKAFEKLVVHEAPEPSAKRAKR